MIYRFRVIVGGWKALVGLALLGAIVGWAAASDTNSIRLGVIGGFLTSVVILGILWYLTWAGRFEAKRYVEKLSKKANSGGE